jgi:type I restriction enzyme S subunit
MKPGYKQTEVGMIPEDWEVGRVGNLILKMKSGLSRRLQAQDVGIPVLTSANIQNNSLVTDELKYWYAKDPQGANIDHYVLHEGDILLCFINSMAQIGKPCVFRDLGRPVIYTTNIFRIIASEVCVSAFAFYLFSSTAFQEALQLIAKAAVNQASFTKPDFCDIRVATPSFIEQRAIAEALSDVDGLLGALDRLIAKKRDLKQAAMQRLLTAQTRLPGFSGEWEVKRIGEFTDCTAGGTPSTSMPSYWGGSIRWMSSGELNLKFVEEVEGRITETGLQNSSTKMIPRKCVLIGLAGQGKTRGTIAMNFIELCTNQSIAAIYPNEAYVSEYLYYNLDFRYDELRELSTGDGGRGGLNLKIIKAISIPFPSLPEQTAIAEVLSEMDAELAALEQRREKTRALKQGMMQELLTGRTRLV